MKKILGVSLVALAFAIVSLTQAEAGSKDGKQRWSFKQTGAGKWHQPLLIPAAKGPKEPGQVVLQIAFKANELAEFFVIGDGDSDLDLYVLDSEKKEVVKDEDPPERGSDLCVARWTPKKDEVFTIVIQNVGKIENVVHAGCN